MPGMTYKTCLLEDALLFRRSQGALPDNNFTLNNFTFNNFFFLCGLFRVSTV